MKIRKSVILLIAFTIIPILVNAQTQYYKLQSYGKTGIENRKVSGGQFITFQAAICMETDIDGVSIGSGILKRNLNNPNLYKGSASWGNGTTFLFSSDKTTLKVTSPNGTIYRYIKSTPPSGVTTCSLIKGHTSSNSSCGIYIPMTTTPSTHSCGVCHGTGQCSTCNGCGYNRQTKYTCGACSGSGRCATCGGDGIWGN